MLKTLTLAIIAAAAIPAAAQAQGVGPTPGPRSGERADILFATNNGIRTFTPEREGRGVWLEDNHRTWYYASFYTRCLDLPYSFGVGFKTFGGSSTLSRGDTIIAGRETCRIADIVRSGPPPEKPRRVRKPRARH
ncbi:hypothetical protein OF829_07190 [Sphingomonas sp. LB-2]|uniref:DUF6491 family protein n=1 Tax=Sphingomonas caeni TaxID=2984949 RepID=UPI00222F0763|nr:DUF6491 family protein [Sphingomonas caeni]MCW3847020.1 hypothetical protein [Sphingomonas caeni]